MEKIEVNEEQIAPYMPVIYKKLSWLGREELIKHFVSVEFNRFLQYYENAEDINVDETKQYQAEKSDRGGKRKNRGSVQFTRFFLNLGKKNGIGKRTIIDLINKHLPNKSVEIGNIEVLKGFSFFEVDSRFENDVLRAFKNAKYKGQRMGIDVAKKK